VGVAGDINSGATLSLPHHFHSELASDGSWHVLGSRDSSGVFELALGFQVLANTRVNDLVPACSFRAYVATGVLPANSVAASFGDVTATTGVLNTRLFNNTAVAFGTTAMTPRFAIAGTDLTLATSFTTPDAGDGTWPDWPIWILTCNTVATVVSSNKGRWQDLAFCNLSLPAGTVDNAITPTFMSVGSVWFPTNAIPSL
jgi:hypothetical protein